ncbi:hypothetical protein FH972_024369 [Carpinus fangiana]|uniref:Uncharacterized protein n=1 Tax=Carpinus fangiana TaxID=176857 RepID=A0A5N6KY58_9ROSI|nr:hypothetical protein FH972_024369 [Carpinus fangiana]
MVNLQPPPSDLDGHRRDSATSIAVRPLSDLSEQDFLVHVDGSSTVADDDAILGEYPRHPVRCMQGAFEESIMDSTDPHALKTRNTLDAAARRLQLLELDQFSDEYSSRWCQKPNARYHPLWKVIAQISFGVHLLHQNLAKSEQEVVNILQGHIREVDAFLEDVTADFDLAIKDIEERTRLLELPLQHGDTFDNMLLDKPFRVAIVEGNDIIERIINRTRKAMKGSLKDISKGCDATAELAKYLDRIGSEWTRGSEELLDIMAAMRGNAEGWYRAFRTVEATGALLSSRLGNLDATVTEVARRAGDASRKDLVIQQAQQQLEKREQRRQLRASRSTPHLASRGIASPALSTRTLTSPAISQRGLASPHMRSSRHVSVRTSQIDKPLPSVPSIRSLMNNAHERSVSQPIRPTQVAPVLPESALTEPSTPELEFEVPGGVSYFPLESGGTSMASSRKSSTSTKRPEQMPSRPPSRGYSDKEVLFLPGPAPEPSRLQPLRSPLKNILSADGPEDSLRSFVTASNVRSPLMKEIITEESPRAESPAGIKSPINVNVRDVDESTSSSKKDISSRGSSVSEERPSETLRDSTYTLAPKTPQTFEKPTSPQKRRASNFGLFPTLNGPPPGAHPLHSNRVSGRISVEIPVRTRRRNLSQETTALPPCPPRVEQPEHDQPLKLRKGVTGKPSLSSFRSLFAKKQAQRQIGNGGLGGHTAI